MQNFLAVFTGTEASMGRWQQLSEAERNQREEAGMAAWEAWGRRHADAIVDDGAPLGKTKRVTAQGVADVRNDLAAYTVVRAESLEAAARMFEGHPHFAIFPGDGVDVMPCLPIPGRD